MISNFWKHARQIDQNRMTAKQAIKGEDLEYIMFHHKIFDTVARRKQCFIMQQTNSASFIYT